MTTPANPDLLARFVEAACVPLDASHVSGTLDEANAILAEHPELPSQSIHAAAIVGDDAAVRRFVAADASAATAKGGPRGWDALTHLAFSRYLRLDRARSDGFVRAAQALLDAGASANGGFHEPSHQPNPTWESVLYGAAGVAHHGPLTRLLLARGADPNDGETEYHSPEWFDADAMCAIVESGRLAPKGLTMMLHRKLDWTDYDGAKWLLEHGADPNAVAPWGNRALDHSLGRDNRLEFVELLLDHGADPTLPTGESTPIRSAAALGRGDVLELLERRGWPTALEGDDAFLVACARGDDAAARALAVGDPALVARVRERFPALVAHFAGAGNAAGLGILLALGFPLDSRTRTGWPRDLPPLHVAVLRERIDTVRFLLDRGAPIEERESRGLTPLAVAVMAQIEHSEWTPHESTALVEMLLAAGARPESVPRFPTGHAATDALLRRYGRT